MQKITLQRVITIATAVVCGCTCIAYEAIRITGWYNRFPEAETPFFEVAWSKQFLPVTLLIYLLLFLPLFIVMFTKKAPKLRIGWLVISTLILIIACALIPDAHQGRWSGTHDEFVLLYFLFIPFLSLVTVLVAKFGHHFTRSLE